MLRKPQRLKRFQTPSHARAPEQERETAEAIGARLVKASGSGNEKGDSRIAGAVRVENKTTQAKSFSVTTKMVKKLEDAAMPAGEIPVLEVELDNGGERVSVVVMPRYALEMLVGKAKEM